MYMARPKKAESTEPKYKLTLQMGPVVVSSTGETPNEAIDALQLPTKIVKSGIFTIEKEGKKKEIKLTPYQIRSLQWKIKRIVLLKYFEFGLK